MKKKAGTQNRDTGLNVHLKIPKEWNNAYSTHIQICEVFQKNHSIPNKMSNRNQGNEHWEKYLL